MNAELAKLVALLRDSPGIAHKRDIAHVVGALGVNNVANALAPEISAASSRLGSMLRSAEAVNM